VRWREREIADGVVERIFDEHPVTEVRTAISSTQISVVRR
jgi:hypothetical protein